MAKKLLCTISATIITVAVTAQCQNFEWAKRINAGRVSERVMTDPAGNVYTLGNNIDQNIFVNTESFITKHSPQGDSLWTAVIRSVNINTANNDYSTKAYDFALDNAGNIYIGGWFRQHVDFDPGAAIYQLSSNTWVNGFENIFAADAYILKLDAQGSFVWAKKYANAINSAPDEFWTITADNAGNLYAAGQSNSTGILYKINSGNGNVIWQKNIQGTEPRIVANNNNQIYLTGYFEGTKDFNPGPGVYNLTSSGLRDAYVMKLDSAGNFIWANRLGGSGHDAGKDLVTDAAGNVFVTGSYTGTATCQSGGTTISLPAGTGNGNNRNGFIAKMNTSDGDFMWVSWFRDASGWQGSIHEEGCGIALDQSGDVYVTGYYSKPLMTSDGQPVASNSTIDMILFKLDNLSGNFTWITSIGGSAADSGKDIAVDADDNILVTGLYNDRLTAVGYPPNVPSPDSVDVDPSPQSAYYLKDNGGYANRLLLKLSNKISSAFSHTMCEENEFDFNGNLLSVSGVYYDTLTSVSGCDSIVTLTLDVFPLTTDSLFATINPGDAYDFNGVPIEAPGIYTDTLTSVNNCDSVVVLTLTIETIGINESDENQWFIVYPNPTEGNVSVELDGEQENLKIVLRNMLGQVISTNFTSSQKRVEIQMNEESGIYLLEISGQKGRKAVLKIIRK